MDDKPEAISYERLYAHWEEGNWSASAIDFSADHDDWQQRFDDVRRTAALWNYAMFLVGEEAVARTLSPVLDAAPTHAQKVFLSTQIVDEARHHVFFDRFVREVAGRGSDPASTLRAVEPLLTWGFRAVFEELDRVTGELRAKPRDRALLAQAVALYHVVVEGLLAIPGQHFIVRYLESLGVLPGFFRGLRNVARDESRHVAFGVKFLKELTTSSAECRAAAIETWDRVIPPSVGVFVPPDGNRSYVESFGFTLEEVYAFALRSFETRLRRIGIEPSEIELLSREDPSLGYEERARRMWVLIDSGILGDDRRSPEPSEEALEVIFDGMARVADLDVARALGGPVQWTFLDARPRYLFVSDGHVEVARGRADRPALEVVTSASQWAEIAMGRVDPRVAVLRRKLKLRGSLAAKGKMQRLFS